VKYRYLFLMSILVIALLCSHDVNEPNDFHKRVSSMGWKWTGGSDPVCCATLYLHEYRVVFSKQKNAYTAFVMRVFDDDGEVLAFNVHAGTVFTRINSVIYLADYSPRSSGCTIIAYNLKGRNRQWETRLLGIGQTLHSGYSNRVDVSVQGELIVVQGKETNGGYVELIDSKTGRTLGNKVFPDVTDEENR
jgi:hypothetical protein